MREKFTMRASRREVLRASSALLLSVPPACARVPRPSGPAPLRIVDTHVHVVERDPRFPFVAGPDGLPTADFPPSMVLHLMKENGVEKTVIIHDFFYGWDCRYAGQVVRTHPREFVGVCRVNPLADTAPDDLTRWVREEGFQCVRLQPYDGPEGDWIKDRKRVDRIWDRAVELGIRIGMLCSTRRLPDVAKVIDRYKDRIDVCIDHSADCELGQPEQLDNLLALAVFPRVFVKVTHLWLVSKRPYPYPDAHDQVKRIYDRFGPRRMMWGSDWPGADGYCGYARALALYRDEIKFFTEEDRRWILGETALGFWKFG